MNFVDFIKPGLPVKITALSNNNFAIILTNIFAKQKSFLFSCFVKIDKKLQNGIMEGKNVLEQKLSKPSIAEETFGDRY